MVIRDGKAVQTEVETGIREGDLVQISKGLSGGETVIVGGSYGLPDKTKVKIAEASAEDAGHKQLGTKIRTDARANPIPPGLSAHSTRQRRPILVHSLRQVDYLS